MRNSREREKSPQYQCPIHRLPKRTCLRRLRLFCSWTKENASFLGVCAAISTQVFAPLLVYKRGDMCACVFMYVCASK